MRHNNVDFKYGWAPFMSNYKQGVTNFYSYDYHIDKSAKSADGEAVKTLFEASYRTSPNRHTVTYKSYSLTDIGGYLGGLLAVVKNMLMLTSYPVIFAMLQSRIIDIMQHHLDVDEEEEDGVNKTRNLCDRI